MDLQHQQWTKDYQLFIYKNILSKAIPSVPGDSNVNTRRIKLVESEPMVVWIRAVTDRSVNPNQMGNYESLEYLGDLEMADHFSAMLLRKYPDIDEKTLTYLKNNKVWKNEQAKLSDSLGLSKFARTIFPMNISKKEDLLEALFGALRILGDKYFGLGQGSLLSYNMIEYLYGDMIINFDILKLKNAKEQFKEIADKLSWFTGKKTIDQFGIAKETLDPKTGALLGYRLIYSLNNLAREWLTTNKYKIKNRGVLADVTDKDKGLVETRGAIEAIDALKDLYNIDWNVADEYKSRKTKIPYSVALQKRMKQDGYAELTIQDNRSGLNVPVHPFMLQLIGVKADGTLDIILTVVKEVDITYKGFNRALYDVYLQKGKQPLGSILNLK